MSFRAGLILVIMAVAAAAAEAHSSDHPIYIGVGGDVESLEHVEHDMMELDPMRRQLGQAGYVSYGALDRNNVPCNQRGQSYYNCREHQTANPYNRGCTRVTHCARNSR